MPIDLNQLRATVLRNQNNNEALPANPGQQVVVDRDANIKMGSEVRPGEAVTQVPQETFALRAHPGKLP